MKKIIKQKKETRSPRDQRLPLRDSKIKYWENLLTKNVDNVVNLDVVTPGPTPGVLRHFQAKVADRADTCNDALRALISFVVPERKSADKTVPAELLKLERAIAELTLGAWNALSKRKVVNS